LEVHRLPAERRERGGLREQPLQFGRRIGQGVDAVRRQDDRAGGAEPDEQRGHPLQVLQGNPFQGSDYTRRVRAMAGLLVGLVSGAAVLGADLLSGALVQGSGGHPLQIAELKTYDWRLTETARPETARKDIALVEIDEYSLRNLQPYAGRWPWPRVVHSMLLDFLARGPAKIIVYDVNFAEADTRTGFDYGGDTLSGAASDESLVKAVQAAGNVVLLADGT